MTVTHSTFSRNSASRGGGGINNDDTSTVTNSTFSGNSAGEGGGGIRNTSNSGFALGVLTLTHSTFSRNSSASGDGGGIINESLGTLNLANTLVADSTGGDCLSLGGALNAFGVNLVEDGTCASDFPDNTDPMLGALAPNGGPTETHAPMAGSSAIDAADDTICTEPPVNSVDQRDEPRPQGVHCDIGSVEVMVAPSPDLAVSKQDSPDPVVVDDHLTYTITVNNAGEADATGVTLTDTLPASVDFVSVTSNDPSDSCGETVVGTVECDLGDMLSGDDATVTLVVQPTETGTITNSVTVTSIETDDNPDNNTATAETTVTELLCNGLVPTLVGTPGNDSLHGTIRRDVIYGLGGDDTISGGLIGKDVLCGGEGNDTLRGGISNDRLFGENGNDTLKGNLGNDALDGGTGTDTCKGGLGRDTGTACESVSGIP